MNLTDEEYTASDIELLQKLVPEYYNPKTMGPMLKEINWDEDFHTDMLTHKGFVVTEKPFDKQKRKTMNGIHSPRFGTSFEDDNALQLKEAVEKTLLCYDTYDFQMAQQKIIEKLGLEDYSVALEKLYRQLSVNVH